MNDRVFRCMDFQQQLQSASEENLKRGQLCFTGIFSLTRRHVLDFSCSSPFFFQHSESSKYTRPNNLIKKILRRLFDCKEILIALNYEALQCASLFSMQYIDMDKSVKWASNVPICIQEWKVHRSWRSWLWLLVFASAQTERESVKWPFRKTWHYCNAIYSTTVFPVCLDSLAPTCRWNSSGMEVQAVLLKYVWVKGKHAHTHTRMQ